MQFNSIFLVSKCKFYRIINISTWFSFSIRLQILCRYCGIVVFTRFPLWYQFCMEIVSIYVKSFPVWKYLRFWYHVNTISIRTHPSYGVFNKIDASWENFVDTTRNDTIKKKNTIYYMDTKRTPCENYKDIKKIH